MVDISGHLRYDSEHGECSHSMKRFYLAQLAPIARVSDAPAADYGALFGVLTYAVYNFTNYSTLKDWPFAGRR